MTADENRMLGSHADCQSGVAVDEEEDDGSDSEIQEVSQCVVEKYILMDKKIFLSESNIAFLKLGPRPYDSVDLYPPQKPPQI